MSEDRRDAHDEAPREDPGTDAEGTPRAPDGDVAPPVDAASLDALAGQLVWRIGRTSDDGPLTVRVGFAGAAATFAELPRLRSAADAEVQAAMEAGDVRVEWVGPRSR